MNETTFFFNKVGEQYNFEVYHNKKLLYSKRGMQIESFSDAVSQYENWKQDQENFKLIMP